MRYLVILAAAALTACSNADLAAEAGAAISAVGAEGRLTASASDPEIDLEVLERTCSSTVAEAKRAVLLTQLCSLSIEKRRSVEQVRAVCGNAAAATDAATDRWVAITKAPQTTEIRRCRSELEPQAKQAVGALEYQIALLSHTVEGDPAPGPYRP